MLQTHEVALLALFPRIGPVLELSSEHVQVCLGIIDSYVLLLGEPLLTQYGTNIATILAGLCGALNERGTMLIFPVLDTIVQCFPLQVLLPG